MRSHLLPIAFVFASAGCTLTPSVGLPYDQTKDYATDAGTIPDPNVDQLPSPYPYRIVPVRGIALQAETVVMTVNGTGDPLAQDVNTLDQSFCAELALPEPADYDVAVVSIGPGAGASRRSPGAGHLKVTYDPTAPDQPGVTGCLGERLSR
jgi:hypothetical protein